MLLLLLLLLVPMMSCHADEVLMAMPTYRRNLIGLTLLPARPVRGLSRGTTNAIARGGVTSC